MYSRNPPLLKVSLPLCKSFKQTGSSNVVLGITKTRGTHSSAHRIGLVHLEIKTIPLGELHVHPCTGIFDWSHRWPPGHHRPNRCQLGRPPRLDQPLRHPSRLARLRCHPLDTLRPRTRRDHQRQATQNPQRKDPTPVHHPHHQRSLLRSSPRHLPAIPHRRSSTRRHRSRSRYPRRSLYPQPPRQSLRQ